MTRRLFTGDVVHVAWQGRVGVVREDPALEGRLVGVRRKDHLVVHRVWWVGSRGGAVETRCSRLMAGDGVEFVMVGDLGALLRPCRHCWSRLGLEAARREVDWVAKDFGEEVDSEDRGKGSLLQLRDAQAAEGAGLDAGTAG